MVGAKPALCSRAWFPVSFVEKKLGPPLAVRDFMVPVPKVLLIGLKDNQTLWVWGCPSKVW